MILPGTYDIILQSNGDFDLQFQLKDGNDTPISLGGSTIESEIWTVGKTAKLANFTVTIVNSSQGIFKLTLNEEQTANMVQDGEYDIRITDASGNSYYWVRGSVTVETGITE